MMERFVEYYVRGKRVDLDAPPSPNGPPIPKADANRTMLITVQQPADGFMATFIRKNFNVRFTKDDFVGELVLSTDPLIGPKGQVLPIGGVYDVGVKATDDPSAQSAFGVTSLGFRHVFWALQNAVLVSDNPVTFKGISPMFKTSMLTPMRDLRDE